MGNSTYAEWSVWATPWMELQQVNQEASEKLVREYISYYTDNTATLVKALQTLPRTTSPEDFVNTQMKLLTNQGEKTLEFMQNVFQIYQDAIKNNCQWTQEKVSTAMKSANSNVKQARRQAEE